MHLGGGEKARTMESVDLLTGKEAGAAIKTGWTLATGTGNRSCNKQHVANLYGEWGAAKGRKHVS
jgi:hypothetical protein